MKKMQALDIADKIKTLAIEKGAWVEVEREFNKAQKLDKITLEITIKVNSSEKD